jgi:succinate dehydrogenase flavin-adding protein (antitoxin of CptAB toxin-antitoxin module)
MILSDPRETGVSPGVCKSLGLHALLDRVRDDRNYSILDLGPALEANVRFWSQFSCSLNIRDFYRSFREQQAAVVPEEESEETTFSALLDFSDEEVFDIILAWDLFNYFNLRELEALVQRLSWWCRRGTRLFALISSLPKISVSPMVFRILNCEQMIYEIPTQAKRLCPRHLPRDIAKSMGRFKVSRSFLSRRGIQEYVFVFE